MSKLKANPKTANKPKGNQKRLSAIPKGNQTTRLSPTAKSRMTSEIEKLNKKVLKMLHN